MNKQEYIEITLDRLKALNNDQNFTNNLSQVRARAIQEEHLPEQSVTDFNFDPKQIWRYCDYIFSENALLLLEGLGNEKDLLRQVKVAAQAFEFLAKFADENDKQILFLNSALCYQIAGYQANASCLTKFIEIERNELEIQKDPQLDLDSFLINSFLDSLLKFLNPDVPRLQRLSAESLDSLNSVQEAVTINISDGSHGIDRIFEITAHACFQQSLLKFVQFCLNGNQQDINNSYENLAKSYRYFEQIGDTILATITSELRVVLNLFRDRSTWSNVSRYGENLIEDRVWRFYLRNLALEKSVVEFWPAQLKALQNNLLTSEDGFIVQMPTSAGKTFIAELAILSALTVHPQSKCLYIAPYRALVNEIEATLSENLGTIGYQVSTLIGGFEFDAFQQYLITESDVLVATPEKVELLLRTNPEYFENLATVIIDEGHILDEGVPSTIDVGPNKTLSEEINDQGNLGRGILLEFLVTRLKQRFSTRFVFLSAVMPEINAEDFVNWLSEQQNEPLRISRAERPSRQVVGKFEWMSKENGEIEYISLEPIPPNNRPPFVHAFLRRKQYNTGGLTPTGKMKKQSWPSNIGNKSQTTALLAARMCRSGPVLVFCAQRIDVTNVINNLVTTFKYLEASNELPKPEMSYVAEPQIESYYQSLEWLGEEHPLTRALHYKIALHYGPLPDPVRQAIEDDFRNDKIQILVSTNTLGQGVNLPIKTAIIHSLERRWPDTDENGEKIHRTSKLRKRDFWNICGRAGRAGKETEGQVIFVVVSRNDRALLNEYQNRNNLEEVESALYQILQALIERRISQEELIGFLDSQILALLAEEIVNTQDEAAIADFLNDSLIGVQALRKNTGMTDLISTIRFLSSWVVQQVPELDRQKTYASTGLRVVSCQTLEEAVLNFLVSAQEELEFARNNLNQCSEAFTRIAFEACIGLSEMQLPQNLTYSGPSDEFILLNEWINGRSISELRTSRWEPDKGEAFSRYISDRVTYKLPWGINGFLRLLAHHRQENFEDLPISWQHLPAMFKYGVNNVLACWIFNLGVTTRDLAIQLANLYRSENFDFDFSEVARWFVNLSNEFILNELVGREFDIQRVLMVRNQVTIGKDLLESVRNPIQRIESSIAGIPYENRGIIASEVNLGDELLLEPEPDNIYDPYAVRVLFRNEEIGYVRRDVARIISRDLLLGRELQTNVINVRNASEIYSFPWIEVEIIFR